MANAYGAPTEDHREPAVAPRRKPQTAPPVRRSVLRFAPNAVLSPIDLIHLQGAVGNKVATAMVSDRIEAAQTGGAPTQEVQIEEAAAPEPATGPYTLDPLNAEADHEPATGPYTLDPLNAEADHEPATGPYTLDPLNAEADHEPATGPYTLDPLNAEADHEPATGPYTLDPLNAETDHEPAAPPASSYETLKLPARADRRPKPAASAAPPASSYETLTLPPRRNRRPAPAAPSADKLPYSTEISLNDEPQARPRPMRPTNVAAAPARPLRTTVKYGAVVQMKAVHANEHLVGFPGLRTLVQGIKTQSKNRGLSHPEFLQAVRQTLKWSPEDCRQWLPLVHNVGKENQERERPRVAQVGDAARGSYELRSGEGGLVQGEQDDPYDTSGLDSKFMGKGYGIYVMAPSGQLYGAAHKVGLFHHSSLLDGQAVAGAGEISATDGTVRAITNKSGHYEPKGAQTIQVLRELRERGVNLAAVSYVHMSAVTSSFRGTKPWGTAERFLEHYGDQPEEADKLLDGAVDSPTKIDPDYMTTTFG